MSYYLVAIDITGIQPYLFNSNRLRENIGASEIVARATQDWVYKMVKSLTAKHNLTVSSEPPEGDLFTETAIEDNQLDIEVIYAGGGNAVLIFAGQDLAKMFVSGLTERAITQAPGLNFVVAQRPFSWTDSLSQAYVDLMKDLARARSTRHPSAPLLGVSVTIPCQSTGLPAIEIDPTVSDGERVIAAEVLAKLDHRDRADQRMKRLLKGDNQDKYIFIKDFNQLGTRNESSYLAVVHADGNGIGGRIDNIAQQYPASSQNRDFIKEIRAFSEKLKRIAANAMSRVIDSLIQAIDPNTQKIISNGLEIQIRPGIKEDQGRDVLPFRPLVVGGDDTTFVCDGRLGLTLAALYLQIFREEAKIIDDHLHACAGIAVVHNHYPFARAYELSEALCGRAKSYVRHKKQISQETGITALDWHFAVTGLLNDLETIRQQEYTVEHGQLYLRPLRLTEPAYDPISDWQTFRNIIIHFQKEWADNRNKLKALSQTLRDGPEATKQFLHAYDLVKLMPRLPENTTRFQETGWSDQKCGYFDALEAVDYFIDVEARS